MFRLVQALVLGCILDSQGTESDRYDYKLMPNYKTNFCDARKECMLQGGDLAMPKEPDEFFAIDKHYKMQGGAALMQRPRDNRGVWIGLINPKRTDCECIVDESGEENCDKRNCQGQLRWVDGGQEGIARLTKYFEKIDINDESPCLRMINDIEDISDVLKKEVPFYLADRECNETYPFLCQLYPNSNISENGEGETLIVKGGEGKVEFGCRNDFNLSCTAQLVLNAGPELPVDDYVDAFDAVTVNMLEINPEEVKQAIQITFPHGETYELLDQATNDDGQLVNTLIFQGDIEAEAYLTIDQEEGLVFGRVGASDGSVYHVNPGINQEAHHVWITVKFEDVREEEKDVIEEPRDDQVLVSENDMINAKATSGRDGYDNPETAHISVKMYYSKDVLEKRMGNITMVKNDINTIMQYTNIGFNKSHLRLKMSVHCVELYPLREHKDNVEMLLNFEKYKTTIRELLGTSDMAFLLVLGRQFTGMAFINNDKIYKPVGIVRLAYALNTFTLGHEAGHVLGALHNREFYTKQGREPPHHYSYGYMMPNTNARSIMSYNSDWRHNVRINYFSANKNVDSKGVRLGDYNIDNSRMILERRFYYTHIGNEWELCPPIEPGHTNYSHMHIARLCPIKDRDKYFNLICQRSRYIFRSININDVYFVDMDSHTVSKCPLDLATLPPGDIYRSTEALTSVTTLCQRKDHCKITADCHLINKWVDPTPRGHAEMVVNYTCEPVDFHVKHRAICEGQDLTLRCTQGQTIHDIITNYGRASPSICQKDGAKTNAATCIGRNTTTLVNESCAKKESCTLTPTDEWHGGDPCPKERKYLEVSWKCK